jgi:hypothetical protein
METLIGTVLVDGSYRVGCILVNAIRKVSMHLAAMSLPFNMPETPDRLRHSPFACVELGGCKFDGLHQNPE